MRIVIRFVAILTLAALVAPEVRWAALRTMVETCACPPAACRCPGHHHAPGQTSNCGVANGGQCGLESHDSYLISLLNGLFYVPTEHPIDDPLQLWGFGDTTARLNLLPSHAPLPDQPPRITL